MCLGPLQKILFLLHSHRFTRSDSSEEPPRHPQDNSNIYNIWIYYCLYIIYILYKFWRWFGVFGSLPSAFWGRPIHYFGHFWWFSPFQWPPRTAPKVWINFYHFIRPNSIIGSCFILVWYMSGVIWKVKSHVRKSECFWNWEIQSVGSLVTVFANFKTTHFFEHEIWPFKWLQTCTKPI